MLSVLLSALCPPAPLKSLTFWRYTNQIIIIIIIINTFIKTDTQLALHLFPPLPQRTFRDWHRILQVR